MALADRKFALIAAMMAIRDEQQLAKLENTYVRTRVALEQLFVDSDHPLQKSIDIDILKKEQDIKPIDRVVFARIKDELDIQEPIDDLLEQLIAPI